MSQEIKVLSECRKLLKLMNLCVKPEMRLWCFNIPHLVIFIALSIPLCYSVTMHTWAAFEIGTNLKKVATVLLTIAGTLQMQLNYFCLQFKNQHIIRAADRIQDVVDRSKLFFYIFFFKKIIDSNFVFFHEKNF